MIYLKSFKINEATVSEDIISDLNEICLEFKDMGIIFWVYYSKRKDIYEIRTEEETKSFYKRNSTSNRINSNTIDGIEEHFISYMKSTEYSNMEKFNFKHSDIVQNIWEFKKKK